MWGIQIVGDSEQVGAWGWGFEVRNGGEMGEEIGGVGSGGRENGKKEKRGELREGEGYKTR